MERETLNLEQLATILDRDVREVSKMASRGYLPGQKVGGQWRFASVEINYWIESQMHAYSEQELTALEKGPGRGNPEQSVMAELLSEQTMAVPLPATTRTSVLKELVNLAEQTWQVYDPRALLQAVKHREDMASTAQPGGVAFPHPHRPNPAILGDSVIAYGRTLNGIPFGQGLCDIFFLICCRDYATHLRALARLSRLMLRPNLLDELRAADSVSQSYRILDGAEKELAEE